jgi:hypothetical protein
MLIQRIQKLLFKPIKKIEWVYALYYKLTLAKELNIAKKEMLVCDIKTSQQIKNELKAIKDYWKCSYTDFYVFYGLYKKRLHIEDLLDFLNYHQEVKHKGIDTIKFKNKLNQYHLFKQKGIVTSELVGIVKDRCLFSRSGDSLSLSSLIERYFIHENSKLFFKPVSGEGGSGIFVLKMANSKLVLNNEEVNINQVVSKLNSSLTYVIEDGIQQRDDISEINPSCVNTLRVIIQDKDEQMHLSVCILRMGRHNSDVDNSAQGGLSIQIDSETGRFSDYATAEHGGGTFYTHPDSNFEFKNKQINGWEDIRGAIMKNAQHLLDFRDIALDVAITQVGIEIIEMNFGYGIDHLQSTCGGMRRTLSIRTPKLKFNA